MNNTPSSDARVDAVFEGIDRTLERVSSVLRENKVNIDLSSARESVRNAGQTVSQTVHKAKTAPVAAGQSPLQVLLAGVKRFLFSLFGNKKQRTPPQPRVADEDLPFVEEEPQHTHEKELHIPPSGDATVDSVVQFQLSQLQFTEDCATQLYRRHAATAVMLEDICRLHRCILFALARCPDLLPKLQKFFGYYIPTLQKFCAAYLDLSKQTAAASNPTAEKTMREIEEAFASLQTAFRKKTDELYGAVELDIASDISVLDAMLRKDGLF